MIEAMERAFIFGLYLDTDDVRITPVQYPAGSEDAAAQATRDKIEELSVAGDYQYVATVAVDGTGSILCTADELLEDRVPDRPPRGQGRYAIVGYLESTGEAVVDSGVAPSRQVVERRTREEVRRRSRYGDYLYLGTVYSTQRATTVFRVENIADSGFY